MSNDPAHPDLRCTPAPAALTTPKDSDAADESGSTPDRKDQPGPKSLRRMPGESTRGDRG